MGIGPFGKIQNMNKYSVLFENAYRGSGWYRVLVHDSNQQTYVAERHLQPDRSSERVIHPAVESYFEGFENGVYRLRARRQ